MISTYPNLEERLRQLPKGLQDHIARVRKIAVELARIHGLDEEIADLAAAAHDIARSTQSAELLKEARRYGLIVHSIEEHMPILLHGPVAASWVRLEAGIDNEEVHQAVYWHSTANRGLGPVAKLVFLADKLDPEKMHRYPYSNRIKALAEESLDRALLEFLNLQIASFLRQGELIHPATIEARNELLLPQQLSPFKSKADQ